MRNVRRVEGIEAAPSTLRLVCSLSGLNATRAFAAKDGRWDGEEIQMRLPTKKCGVGEVAAKTDN